MKLNGVSITPPTHFEIQSYPITEGGRTADGVMHLDLIRWARKFAFRYDIIKANNYKTIIDILESNLFITLEYPDEHKPGGVGTAVVYRGAVNRAVLLRGSNGLYVDFSFDLIER